MPSITICIDPGRSGGVAIRHPDGRIELFPMPKTESEVLDLLVGVTAHCNRDPMVESRVFIERVGGFIAGKAHPGSSMFNFGKGVGFIIGVIRAKHLPLYEVTPQAWQKKLGIGTKGKRTDAEWKRLLVDNARKKYPTLDGITQCTADALLILDTCYVHSP